MHAGLVALESISPGKDIYYSTLRCRTLPSKEKTTQGSDQLHGFFARFFFRSYSAVLSFPPRGVTGTSGYRFEYDLHLIKIPSHLDRESIYIKDEKHPEVFEKCELVGKGPSIPRYMQEMHLYFTGGMFYVNVRLAIELSLAKLAKRIYDLRHRLAIITL